MEVVHAELLKGICKETLEAGGATQFFARNVAHRLHSLSLEDIHLYFSDAVTAENGVPTVNKDLESEERVLKNAPLLGYDTSFSTPALQYLDMVLKHMDKAHYSITNFGVLEKLSHVYHMAELWTHASVHYASLLLQPPTSQMCTCAADNHLNTIIQELNLLALKIKYPGITSGNYEKGMFNDYGYGIQYNYGKSEDSSPAFQEALAKFDFSGDESDVVQRLSVELVDGDRGMEKNLDSEEGWAYWKEKVQSMDEVGNYEFALFMYCKLNA